METNEWELLKRKNEGNELLYGFCKNADNWSKKEFLSPQIWLIGRSYAASPQRRSYKKNKNGERSQTELSDKGDGTDTFFDELADNLLNDKEYKSLIKEIKGLQKESYEYEDNIESDKNILICTAQSVIKFNKILRKAIKDIDNAKDDDGLTNFMSFSSKFLHFYAPKVFFITDSISEATLRSLFNSNINLTSLDSDDIKKYTDLLQKLKDEFDNEKAENNGFDYIRHCCRAYVLACRLKKDSDNPGVVITPRAIDNYLLYVLARKIKGKS